MNLDIFCLIALIVSVTIVVVSVASVVYLNKKWGAENSYRTLSSLQIFLVCFFFAAAVMFFPIYYVDYVDDTIIPVKIFKSAVLSMQNVLRLITLNGDFNNIRDFFGGYNINSLLATVYSVYSAIVILALPLITAGYILSFFKDTIAAVRYGVHRNSDVYIFSDLRPNTVALAQDIKANAKDKSIVVFANAVEEDPELISAANRLNAILLKKSIDNISVKNKQTRRRKFYLFGPDEDENLNNALSLINRFRGGKYDRKETEIYLLSHTAESEALLNSTDNGDMKVRRIVEARNLAEQLVDKSIFDNAVNINGVKQINIMIVGMGRYGSEILKTLSWCCQLPGYVLTVHAFDRDNAQARLRAAMPEFIDKANKKTDGEAEYYIKFYECDINSQDFSDKVSSIDNLTGVFVTLGNDDLNIQTAITVRQQLGRNAHYAKLPPICTMVHNPSKIRVVENKGLVNMNEESYGINFLGKLKTLYSVKGIEQSELEKQALNYHLKWADTLKEKENEERKFNNFEYFQRSSAARTYYVNMRSALGFQKQDEGTAEGRKNNDILREYEHRRWNTYMRTEGYVYGENKDHIAKTHPMLVPYQMLSDKEKAKDDF